MIHPERLGSPLATQIRAFSSCRETERGGDGYDAWRSTAVHLSAYKVGSACNDESKGQP